MKYKLRPYQEQSKKDIENFLENSSFDRGIVVKPVGSGKAITTAVIADMVMANCLVIQPTAELLSQNLEKARSFGMDPSIYSGSFGSKEVSKLTYATPMSVIKNPDIFKYTDIVIIDECHIGMTNSIKYNKIASKGKFNSFLEQVKPSKVIGLTATPIQLVTTGLGSELKMVNRSKRSYWYQSDIFHVTQISDIKDEYWADIEYRALKDIDDSNLLLNSTGAEFTEESILESYEKNNLNDKILSNYESLISEGRKSILTFVPSVMIGKRLKKLNKDFEVVHGEMSQKERDAVINDFKKGNIPNLINCEILTTGFDHPNLDGIIMARNTNSFSLYYQIIGRIVRPIIKPDGSIFRKKGVVVDLTTNYSRFGKIDDITFEKQDYTKGWAMWNGDMIMTGIPFSGWELPKRKSIKARYDSLRNAQLKDADNDIQFTFGKYKDTKVKDVLKKDKGYIRWLLDSGDFKWNAYNKPIKKEIFKLLKESAINNNE